MLKRKELLLTHAVLDGHTLVLGEPNSVVPFGGGALARGAPKLENVLNDVVPVEEEPFCEGDATLSFACVSVEELLEAANTQK